MHRLERKERSGQGEKDIWGQRGQTHMFLCCDLDRCLGPTRSSGPVSCLERPGPVTVLVLISVRCFLQCVSLQ